MIYCHLSSATNSTLFTNCCRAAITDREANCPVCGEKVVEQPSRWNIAFKNSMSPKRYAEHQRHVAQQIANDRRIDAERKPTGPQQ